MDLPSVYELRTISPGGKHLELHPPADLLYTPATFGPRWIITTPLAMLTRDGFRRCLRSGG
jgi:hypothetical protein